MNEYIVRKKVVIKAKPSDVWNALTNPKLTKKYFNCEALSDWKEGSAITFKGKMFLFIKIELTGTILKIEPEKLLQYTIGNKSGKNSDSFSTVTDKLSYSEGYTTLEITDNVGKGDGAGKRYKRSEKGWDKILKGLKDLVEGA